MGISGYHVKEITQRNLLMYVVLTSMKYLPIHKCT